MPVLTKITKMHAQPYSLFRRLGIWALMGLLLACQKPTTEAPADLIPKPKMAQILTEIHLAEARVTKLNRISQDTNTLIYKHLERQIYKKYQVDTAVYNKSYTYYAADPQQLADIYKLVTEELEKRKKPGDSSGVAKTKLPNALKRLKK
ncbi:DUF4296 domain-containing protein [Larkinella sp. VNQ87]|uniref:DUF4296 domain-containing protein n=1 Tax=Larkinella sp. VNQ87 TaxID=3400921 RepID=UPI003C110CEA